MKELPDQWRPFKGACDAKNNSIHSCRVAAEVMNTKVPALCRDFLRRETSCLPEAMHANKSPAGTMPCAIAGEPI
jgi:hypothetical protein